jgi:hypothetical protein
MLSEKRYRIDKFDVPVAAREAFLARIRIIDAILAAIDGCESHKIYERRIDGGGSAVVTIAQWRDEAAMAAAAAIVTAEYSKTGFDPRAFMAERGVAGDFGVYSESA